MAIASILAFFVLILRKNTLIISFSKLKKYSFQGLIIALHWITFFEAIKQSNISITLAMFSTAAFFTSILEPIFYKRNIKFSEIFHINFTILLINQPIDHSQQRTFTCPRRPMVPMNSGFSIVNENSFTAMTEPKSLRMFEISINIFCEDTLQFIKQLIKLI